MPLPDTGVAVSALPAATSTSALDLLGVQAGVTKKVPNGTYERHRRDANVVAHGADITGATMSTAAFQAAATAANAAAVTFQPGGTGASTGSVPTVVIPAGRYKLDAAINLPAYTKVVCESRATIEQTVTTADIFVWSGGYMGEVEGISFVGGKRHVVFGNANTDSSSLVLNRCEFHKNNADFVVDTVLEGGVTNLSLTVTVRDCKFVSPFKVMRVQPGVHARWEGENWILLLTGAADAAMFENRGALTLTMYGVPDPLGPSANRRWVDNYGNFTSLDTRYGGEGSGMPVVNHLGAAQDVYPWNGGSSVVILGGAAVIGPDVGPQYLIQFSDHIPQLIEVRDVFNLAHAVGGYIKAAAGFDIATYLAARHANTRFYINVENNLSWPSLTEGGVPAALLTADSSRVIFNHTYAGYGSATKPSISFIGDTITGFFRSAATKVGLAGRFRGVKHERMEAVGDDATDACVYLDNLGGGGRRWRWASGQEGITNNRLVMRDITGARDWLVAYSEVVDAAANPVMGFNVGVLLLGGASLWSAAGVPAASLGFNGDWCFSQNGNIYVKAAGAWTLKV